MRIAITITALTLIVGMPQFAAAQSEEDLERFEAKISTGQRLFDDGQYEEAVDVLHAAEEIFSHPTLGIRIVEASAKAGYCEQAQTRLTGLRRIDQADELAQRLDEAQQIVGRCVSTGIAVVECTPDHAQVEIDATFHPCGVEIELETGSHQGRVFTDGHKPNYANFTVRENERTTLTVTLETLSPPTESSSGFPTRKAGLVGMIAGAGLLGAGLGVDSRASGRQQRMEDALQAGDMTTLSELEQQAERRRRQTLGLFASGAIFASLGTALYVLGGSSDDASTTQDMALVAGLRSLGVQLSW